MSALTASGVAASAVLLFACAASGDPDAPTYHDDIAPLLARSCLPCHGEASSHHSLSSYQDVAAHAERALALMRAGSMPKGNVDRSGACGEFTEPAPVGAAELELFAAFIEHGMQEGEAPVVSNVPDEPPIARTTLVAASEPYLPATDVEGGSGDHRCFVLSGAEVEAGAEELRAFRVLATSPELVHHVMLFALDADLDARTAQQLDHGAAGPGWPCFGTPGIAGARLIGVWTPGRDVVRFPDDYATRLGRAGLLAQVHYDGPPPSAAVGMRFELELSDGSARELRFLPFAAVELTLPPQRESVWTAHRGRLGIEAGGELLGVYPHMHALGRRLSLHAQLGAAPAAHATCLVDVPRWNHTFQELALYRAPLPIDVDDPELTIECEHATLGVEHRVSWGERMEDEMCMAFVVVAAAR